jgi:hypothetical protein
MLENVTPVTALLCGAALPDALIPNGVTVTTPVAGASGVYALTAPIGTGSAVGAAAAYGKEVVDVVTRTGKEGVRLATVP